MRFGINLRGDLAKLDDAEIASRYEALIAEKVARHKANPPQVLGSKWLYRIGEWMIWRGPFRRGSPTRPSSLASGLGTAPATGLFPRLMPTFKNAN